MPVSRFFSVEAKPKAKSKAKGHGKRKTKSEDDLVEEKEEEEQEIEETAPSKPAESSEKKRKKGSGNVKKKKKLEKRPSKKTPEIEADAEHLDAEPGAVESYEDHPQPSMKRPAAAASSKMKRPAAAGSGRFDAFRSPAGYGFWPRCHVELLFCVWKTKRLAFHARRTDQQSIHVQDRQVGD